MKNILKVFLLLVSLVLMLAVTVVPTLAAEAASGDAEAVADNAQSDIVVNSYIDEEDNMILVFADGRKYNVTVGEWSDPSEEKGINIKFNPDNMLNSLKYMWQGMLCIFVVIGVIILSVYLMGYISSKAEEKKQVENNESNE